MNRFTSFIMELLFPSRCPWCGDVTGGRQHACEAYQQVEDLRLAPRELPAPSLPQEWLLQGVWACFRYEEPVRGTILRMKFEAERNLAVPMGKNLADRYRDCALDQYTDVLVPVPMSPVKQRARGYNQSALVAWELASQVARPCLPNALLKVRETTPQSELGRAERLTNVAGAYQADEKQLAGKRVMLVDDILTTGSTLNECAKSVLDAGATECRALCIAAARVDAEVIPEPRLIEA